MTKLQLKVNELQIEGIMQEKIWIKNEAKVKVQVGCPQ
jgi:hypothetical protein